MESQSAPAVVPREVVSEGTPSVPSSGGSSEPAVSFEEVEFVEESGRLILRKRAPKNYPIDESVGILAARKGDTDAIIEALRGR